MNIEQWQKNWDALGKDDPLWVVLTDPTKKDGRWEPAEFFALGVKEINALMEDVARLKPTLDRGRALDFGCGVGRLSQALSHVFREVHGVDISPSMVGHARQFNQFADRCHYHVNGESHLRLFPDNHFDFVYSNITLQHIEPHFAKGYIAEFVRVLKPGGLVVFQVCTPSLWRSLVPDAFVRFWRRRKFKEKAFIGMFGIPDGEVAGVLSQAGTRTLRLDKSPLDNSRWLSRRYFVTK